jgi:serine/threonine-protein kinase
MSVQVGDILDQKYRIVRLIGRGGMGSVFEGQHVLIERRIAVKVLHSPSPDVVTRFVREAQAAGRIRNDHILEVLDVGALPDGSPYMVTEFLEGETLLQRLARQGRLPPRAAVPLVIELLDGLAAAHRAGIVHRDLKPDNVFLVKEKAGRQDYVKIIDFGISKFTSGQGGLALTRTGQVMGTPYYLAPEQARDARSVDARSDLYAVGAILYEIVTGRVPFEAVTLSELLVKVVSQSPTPPTRIVPEIDPQFSALVLRAMAREPDQRFQSAEELVAALRCWVTPEGARTSVLPAASASAPLSLDRPPSTVAPPQTQVPSEVGPLQSLLSLGSSRSFGPGAGTSSGPGSGSGVETSSGPGSGFGLGPTTMVSANLSTSSAFGGTHAPTEGEAESWVHRFRSVIMFSTVSVAFAGFAMLAVWRGYGHWRTSAAAPAASSEVVSPETVPTGAPPQLPSPTTSPPPAIDEVRIEPATLASSNRSSGSTNHGGEPRPRGRAHGRSHPDQPTQQTTPEPPPTVTPSIGPSEVAPPRAETTRAPLGTGRVRLLTESISVKRSRAGRP